MMSIKQMSQRCLGAWQQVAVAAVLPAMVLLLSAGAYAQNTSTHSFTAGSVGSHPNTLSYGGGVITVDMNALPQGTVCYRAQLITQRSGNIGAGLYSDNSFLPVEVEAADAIGTYLPFVQPRRVNLDCTAAVQRILDDADRVLTLNVISFPSLGTDGTPMRVDVWCDQPAVSPITQVTNLAAIHSDGDTRLTFTEVNSPLTATNVTLDAYYAAKNSMDNVNQVRYRVYRSAVPFTATSVRTAELVDEIPPLTCWNPDYYTAGETGSELTPRLAVTDLTFVAPETGIYVNRAQATESAYYAVSRVVDGQEDLTAFTSGNSLSSAVAESPGAGAVILQRVETPVDFQFVSNPTLNYYVRWECPPTCSMPSRPYDYLVAVPNDAVSPRGVDVALHCWGGSLNACYGWWYNAENGYLLVSSNQIPYDWWTDYHENYGTAASFSDGKVHNYNQLRTESFVDNFVKANYPVDDERIMVGGSSMGGSGASMYGMKNGDRYAYIVSWVGVHRPSMSPLFTSSYEGVYGKLAWDCPYYTNDMPVFEYEDMVRWLTDNPTVETPYIAFANGKNDSAIGWPQAADYVDALIATKRPFNFVWGQSGHSQRAELPGGTSDRYTYVDIALGAPLPAFANCSLDDNYGNGDPLDGDEAGQVNGYLFWEPSTVVDLSDQFEMTCKLEASAPQATCTVDLTPRRTTNFVLTPGQLCTWNNTDIVSQVVIQSGQLTADVNGLATVPSLTVSKGGNRVHIETGGTPDTTPPEMITDLAASNPTVSTVDLTWTAPGDDADVGTAISYDVRYATTAIDPNSWPTATQATGEPVPQPAGSTESMTVTGLSSETTYYLAIKTTDEASNVSLLSNVVTRMTTAPDITPPTAPLNVVPTAVSFTEIDLAWAASDDPESGIDHYIIYRDTTQVGTSATTSFGDTGLTEGTDYSYEISAVNGESMEGSKSTPVMGSTVADVTPPAIDSVTAQGDPTQIIVVFTEPVEQSTAQTPGHYTLDGGLTVNAASLAPDMVTVTLTVSPNMAAGTTYTLTITDVTDRATTPNPVAANTTGSVTFISIVVLQQNLDGYMGVEDTWFEYGGADQYYDHGGLGYLRNYNDIETGGWRKILVRFDLTNLGSMLPVGGLITSAKLHMYQYQVEFPSASLANNVAVAKMSRPWEEGQSMGTYDDPITGASYLYCEGAIRNPVGWTQNVTYSNVWELDVTGQTVDHCQQDRGWNAQSWVQKTSVADVASSTWSWYQSGNTLYVNKDNSTTQDPTASADGFSYLLSTAKWDGPGGTGAGDVDISSKIVATWPNYDQAYDPNSPGVLSGAPNWVEVDITSYVHDWQASPSTNYGLMVAKNNVGATMGRFFRSSEYDAGGGDYTFGPKLVIEYDIVVVGDLDGDGDVDLTDLAALVAAMNGPGQPTGNPLADLDGDGDCDLADGAAFAAAFGGS